MSRRNTRIHPKPKKDDKSSESDLWDGYAAKSLGLFKCDLPLRKQLLHICKPGSKFDSFILAMILLNAVIMACVDYRYINQHYEPVSDQSLRNYLVEKAEIFFVILFTLECAIKMIAWGFIEGEKAYIRSSWNLFDFGIAVCSIASFLPIIPNLSVLRSLRVLRPLRSISKLPGLRKIVIALVESVDDLCNVMFLLTFLIFCFSIMGILFWNGILHGRCRLTPFPIKMPRDCLSTMDPCWNYFLEDAIKQPDLYRCLPDANDDPNWTQSTSPWFRKGPQNCVWPIDDDDQRICSLSGIGLHSCPPSYSSWLTKAANNRTCGSNFDRFGNNRFLNDEIPYGFPRMKSGTFLEDLNWGFTTYDSFFTAFITTFQVITLEGWTDVMNQVVDAWYFCPTVVIFCVEVILCGYIVLNLVLAVITNSLEEHVHEDDSTVIEEAEIVEPPDKEDMCTDRLVLMLRGRGHSIFIMICIILNTVVLSLDHYGISDSTADTLETLNAMFTVIFFFDVILCNIAFGFKKYWSDSFMCFDGVIGIISVIELMILYIFPSTAAGSSSFSIFRSLRLFRIFKIARSWRSLNALLRTMISSVTEIGNFAVLLLLFMFIYSLIGMQLLSNRLHFSQKNGDVIGIDEADYNSAYIPRSHFDSFLWSMITVFQILTGENWNAIMYDGWRSKGVVAVIYIISLLVIGVFIVMNLFLAILLKKFEENGSFIDEIAIEHRKAQLEEDLYTEVKRPSVIQILWAKLGKNNFLRTVCYTVVESTWFEIVVTILIVCSSFCLVFDGPLLNPNSFRVRFLHQCDIVFTTLFCVEMIIKVLAYGLILEKKAYLRNSWNVLDFVTLIVSVLNLAEIGPGSSLRALRTLRVLRPLRMVNRFPGLKIVVDALLLSFPSVADVAVLCSVFFLIFASFGVNFLKGTFYHCNGEAFDDLSEEQVEFLTYPIRWGDVSVKQMKWFDVPVDGCKASSWTSNTIPTSKDICNCLAPGGWTLAIPQNFNNVMNGMALLFEIATTEGWVNVMYAAIDQRGIGMQPVRDSNPFWAIFFVVFLLVGAFFILELFVGVTIDNFNKIRERTGRGMMTDAQRVWAATQSFVMKIKPEKRIPRPSGKIQSWCYDFVMPHSNPKFQDFITACIVISSILTAMVSFGDPEVKIITLEVFNSIFSGIFTIEVVMKLVAFRTRYFDDGWNRFDFIVVCGSNIFIIVDILLTQIGPLSSVIRFLRVCRLFRLIKRVKKLRLLFNTLLVSIPSIVNIGSLLLLLFFIYAAIGMQLFSFIPNNSMVTENANFRYFGSAMFLLLRFSTGENWNGYMRSMIPSTDNCDENPIYNETSPWCFNNKDNAIDCTEINGCGAGMSAYFFFYSFTLLVSYVILNLFVGIVLEAFEHSNEGDILSPNDMDHFTKCWSEFDPNATWHINTGDMKRLLVKLGSPLGVERRDLDELESVMKDDCLRELPVNQNGGVNIVHVATSLAKRLTKMKQGDEFHELSDDHPVQIKMASTLSKTDRTLNEILAERSKKKLKILRAFVRSQKISPAPTAGEKI